MSRLEDMGVVLEYVFHEVQPTLDPFTRHRAAALAGIEEIARRLDHRPVGASSNDSLSEQYFYVRWDASALSGQPVSFSDFWGSDDVVRRGSGKQAWSLPEVDGYKSAFFLPPYGLRDSADAQAALFTAINVEVFGSDMEQSEIFAWSTDWSNFFDAGRDWWGAFYWTVYRPGSNRMVAIGASSTD